MTRSLRVRRFLVDGLAVGYWPRSSSLTGPSGSIARRSPPSALPRSASRVRSHERRDWSRRHSGAHLDRRRHGDARARGPRRAGRREHAAARRRSAAHRARPRRSAVRGRQRARRSIRHRCRSALGFAAAPARGPASGSRSRARTTDLDYRVDARRHPSGFRRAGEYRIVVATRARDDTGSRARRCFADRPSSSDDARPHARPRRHAARSTTATRAPSLPVRRELRGVGRLRSLGRGSARRAHRRRRRRSTCPTELRYYGGAFDRLRRRGITSRPTGTCGTRASPSAGVRTHHGRWSFYGSLRLDLGRRSIAGRGRRITTAAGAIVRTAGSGFRVAAGRRRGSRGATRPATSAGARSAIDGYPVVDRLRHTSPWHAWTVLPHALVHPQRSRAQRRRRATDVSPNRRWSQFAVRDAGPVGPTVDRGAPRTRRCVRRPSLGAGRCRGTGARPCGAVTGSAMTPQSARAAARRRARLACRRDGAALSRTAPVGSEPAPARPRPVSRCSEPARAAPASDQAARRTSSRGSAGIDSARAPPATRADAAPADVREVAPAPSHAHRHALRVDRAAPDADRVRTTVAPRSRVHMPAADVAGRRRRASSPRSRPDDARIPRRRSRAVPVRRRQHRRATRRRRPREVSRRPSAPSAPRARASRRRRASQSRSTRVRASHRPLRRRTIGQRQPLRAAVVGRRAEARPVQPGRRRTADRRGDGVDKTQGDGRRSAHHAVGDRRHRPAEAGSRRALVRSFGIIALFLGGGAVRHGERRALRVRRRPPADLGARRLLAEHDHARPRRATASVVGEFATERRADRHLRADSRRCSATRSSRPRTATFFEPQRPQRRAASSSTLAQRHGLPAHAAARARSRSSSRASCS